MARRLILRHDRSLDASHELTYSSFLHSVLRRVEQVDGDVMMSTYVRSESSPSVSWKVGSFQAFVEAKVRLICRERIV